METQALLTTSVNVGEVSVDMVGFTATAFCNVPHNDGKMCVHRRLTLRQNLQTQMDCP